MHGKKLFRLFLPLIIYSLVAYLFYGRGVFSQGPDVVYGNGNDGPIYYWFLSWFHYAFTHHLSIWHTDYVWTATGFNLTQATSIFGLYLLSLPLQLFTHSITIENILAVFTPAFAAWTMYLLCFDLTKKWMPAVIAAYFFGFSGFVTPQMLGHLNLTGGLFLIPLMVWLPFLIFQRRLNRWWGILLNSLCFIWLFLISKEILLIFSLCLWVAGVFSWLLFPCQRRFIKSHIFIWFLTYVISFLVLSVYLYYFFFGLPNYLVIFQGKYGNPILQTFIPSRIYQCHWMLDLFSGAVPMVSGMISSEATGYIGLPLLLLLGFFSFSRSASVNNVTLKQILLLMICFIWVVSLGAHVYVTNSFSFYNVIDGFLFRLPLLKHILVSRFTFLLFFCISLCVALYLAQLSTWKCLGYTLALVAVVAFIPNLFNRVDYPRYTHIDVPVFFKNENSKKELVPGETILLWAKQPSWADYYQAVNHFYFKLGAAYLGFPPRNAQNQPYALSLILLPFANSYVKPDALHYLVRSARVQKVIVTREGLTASAALTKIYGDRFKKVSDVYLLNLNT